MNIEEIVTNMTDNLLGKSPLLAHKVANDILTNKELAESYSMDELSQLVMDTAKIMSAKTETKTKIIDINFTSYTGNSLSLLISIDGKREYKHLEFDISEKALHQYGIYEFRDLASITSGYLNMKLSKAQITLLTARLFKAAQDFVIGG